MHYAVRLDTRGIQSSQNRETQCPCSSELTMGWVELQGGKLFQEMGKVAALQARI